MPALGLRPADVATQVVIRDGIAEWVSALAVLATVCEAVALEVRHGQRTEVRELQEPFRAGQTVVIQPNVVTRDGTAGVQTGEMVLITDTGVERFHNFPRGFAILSPSS